MLQLPPLSRNALTKCYKRPGSYCKTEAILKGLPPLDAEKDVVFE